MIESVSSLDEEGKILQNSPSDFARKHLICISKKKLTRTPMLLRRAARSVICNKEDDTLYRILSCVKYNTTMYKAKAMIDKKDKDMPEALRDAFSDTTKHVLNKDESSKLDDTILEEIYNKVEEFDILNKPMLPKFECPRGLTEEAYLKELCELAGIAQALARSTTQRKNKSTEIGLKKSLKLLRVQTYSDTLIARYY